MANSNGWGDGAANNAIGWGQGANNAIGWGDIHADSWAGLTDIVGTPPVPPYSYLLDDYSGAAAAYSLRKLRTAYSGNAIRVRRSSDNTEQDFGFVNNVLDTASLLTFCGAGNGFVTTWYDQSGNANNGVQTTGVFQPQIVSSGAMITTNGKNSMSFDGSNDHFNLTSTINVAASNYNSFVGKKDNQFRILNGLGQASGQGGYLFAHWNDSQFYLQAKSNQYIAGSVDSTTPQRLLTGLNNAGTQSIFRNGSVLTTVPNTLNVTLNITMIGRQESNYAFCNLQEIVFYNSEQSANRTGIETNINTFYTIY
jgi:hypothetical protein